MSIRHPCDSDYLSVDWEPGREEVCGLKPSHSHFLVLTIIIGSNADTIGHPSNFQNNLQPQRIQQKLQQIDGSPAPSTSSSVLSARAGDTIPSSSGFGVILDPPFRLASAKCRFSLLQPSDPFSVMSTCRFFCSLVSHAVLGASNFIFADNSVRTGQCTNNSTSLLQGILVTVESLGSSSPHSVSLLQNIL
ncbi:hypothetical protein JAAARDRAFT_195416 [Jaapia argillacea MUCL 33604]|uniref:Uncharacterized protein n=1 Tax=Jaapia argillacea MUCL 33604 TaxID=933084 RepID=A0A067PL85_9AGAM|nr:hypothetical protein JAAARDRAFT_195416 [Jaapia argillacea MUCL 33604]